jgi:hypothetical protein
LTREGRVKEVDIPRFFSSNSSALFNCLYEIHHLALHYYNSNFIQALVPDAMADGPGSEASANSPMFPAFPAFDLPDGQLANYNDAMNLDLDLDFAPAVAFTEWPTELTSHLSGDTASNANNNVTPVPQFPQFDPSSLLNPRSTSSKRPASSGGDPDRGRPDPTIAGQVSLVERLHNVQERTSSPAKRVKTEEELRRAIGTSGFGSGSALGLQRSNGQAPTQPSAGPAIDLTMSRCARSNPHKPY